MVQRIQYDVSLTTCCRNITHTQKILRKIPHESLVIASQPGSRQSWVRALARVAVGEIQIAPLPKYTGVHTPTNRLHQMPPAKRLMFLPLAVALQTEWVWRLERQNRTHHQ